MKNIGNKRKSRIKVVREKMIRRRAKAEKEVKEQRKKERFDYESRRKQEPIKRGQFNDPTIPMSQEREVVIVDEHLKGNLAKLRELESEFIDRENNKEANAEKLKEIVANAKKFKGIIERAERDDAR